LIVNFIGFHFVMVALQLCRYLIFLQSICCDVSLIISIQALLFSETFFSWSFYISHLISLTNLELKLKLFSKYFVEDFKFARTRNRLLILKQSNNSILYHNRIYCIYYMCLWIRFYCYNITFYIGWKYS